jgi:hypothetical protein
LTAWKAITMLASQPIDDRRIRITGIWFLTDLWIDKWKRQRLLRLGFPLVITSNLHYRTEFVKLRLRHKVITLSDTHKFIVASNIVVSHLITFR